jgi:tetratricopeptide (TPR) repeat protein
MQEKIPDDLLQSYLLGKLAAQERALLEEKIGSDPDLARAVALHRAEMAASELLIAEETRQMFQEWKMPRRTLNRPILWIAGLGAVLTLLTITVWQTTRPATPPAPAANPKPTPTESPSPVTPMAEPPAAQQSRPNQPVATARPGSSYRKLAGLFFEEPALSNFRQVPTDSILSIFSQAQQAYTAGNYQQTLDLLAQTDSTRRQSAIFLRANALFHLGRFAAAEAQFATLVDQNSRQYRYPAEWGLLLCRLANTPNREQVFRQQLDAMLLQPEHPYFEQAKKLKKEIPQE